MERDALRDTLGPDLVSEEGKAEHARIAAQVERGGEIRADKRRAAQISASKAPAELATVWLGPT